MKLLGWFRVEDVGWSVPEPLQGLVCLDLEVL